MTDAPRGRLRGRLETLVREGPGGPFDRRSWRSPLRGPWLTSVLGLVLLVGFPVVIVTGLLSYAAYDPSLGGSNEQTPGHGLLGGWADTFAWPTSPVWLYRVTQGTHVLLGLALVPVLLSKLWSVAPKLFEWPPVNSPAQAVERVSILLIVASSLFQLVTGVMNIQYDYAWGFSFYTGHFYGAWVFIVAFAAHVAIKMPTLVRSLRSRSFTAEMRTPTDRSRPEPPDPDLLVPPEPAEPTISRRGVLALTGGASAAVVGLSAGQSIDPLRRTALLSPRGQDLGDGPNDFQVNTTFADARIDETETRSSWRLTLVGPDGERERLTRGDLLALPLATHELPIACVEGWSTSQSWTGVPLRDLAERVGGSAAEEVFLESLQRGGAFATMSVTGRQLRDPRTMVALLVNGADLSLDHGFPARLIVPAAPGVRNTKWLDTVTFQREVTP
ncbi:MAG TPA: molybdopterin-dependent oxidoreductase [Mycobacteriales bacterium]|nr:molybdopterin-dependent oxidoreductase [Mycobacteriales bacterium]